MSRYFKPSALTLGLGASLCVPKASGPIHFHRSGPAPLIGRLPCWVLMIQSILARFHTIQTWTGKRNASRHNSELFYVHWNSIKKLICNILFLIQKVFFFFFNLVIHTDNDSQSLSCFSTWILHPTLTFSGDKALRPCYPEDLSSTQRNRG